MSNTLTEIETGLNVAGAAGAALGGASPEEMELYTAADAWMTLEGGFTTVQSVGSTFDKPVRDLAIDAFDWSSAGRFRLKGVADALALHRARRLAGEHRAVTGRGPNNLLPRLDENERQLRDYNRATYTIWIAIAAIRASRDASEISRSPNARLPIWS